MDNVNSSPSPELDRVIDRLRQLELRLTSLGGKEPLYPEAVRAVLQDREQARGKQYANAVRLGSGFALEVTTAIDSRIAVRMDQVASRATANLDFALGPLALDSVEQQLENQEKRVPAMMEQFALLRHSAIALEDRLTAVGNTLDKIWKEQDPAGFGGWRLVMRAVSAQVELEKEKQPPFVDSYRARPETPETLPVSAGNIACRRCKEPSLRRIARQTLIEELLRMAFVAPYRCTSCGIRSYHFRYTVKTAD